MAKLVNGPLIFLKIKCMSQCYLFTFERNCDGHEPVELNEKYGNFVGIQTVVQQKPIGSQAPLGNLLVNWENGRAERNGQVTPLKGGQKVEHVLSHSTKRWLPEFSRREPPPILSQSDPHQARPGQSPCWKASLRHSQGRSIALEETSPEPWTLSWTAWNCRHRHVLFRVSLVHADAKSPAWTVWNVRLGHAIVSAGAQWAVPRHRYQRHPKDLQPDPKKSLQPENLQINHS